MFNIMPKGYIERSGYTRKSHHRKGYVNSHGTRVKPTTVKKTVVPATMIKDQGKPGKGKRLIDMEDYRHLSKYGYDLSKTTSQRHSALNKAQKDNGYSWTVKRVNAVSVLQKNSNPENYSKLRSDLAYVQSHRQK